MVVNRADMVVTFTELYLAAKRDIYQSKPTNAYLIILYIGKRAPMKGTVLCKVRIANLY